MSLEESEKTGEGVDLSKPVKTTKKERAKEIALKYKGTLDTKPLIKRVMEEVPCSESVAFKAWQAIQKGEEQEKELEPEKGGFKVVQEEGKKPAYIPEVKQKKEARGKLETIETKEPQIEELTPEEMQEQLDIFRDMLRGIHVLLLSKEGLLGERYGRKVEQCEQVSDQLYRYLRRRYSIEDLERWDTILLVGSYGTLIGGIAKDFIQERQKRKEKEQAKEEKKT